VDATRPAVEATGRPQPGPTQAGTEFKDVAAALPAALAVGAAAVYGVLIVAYSQFYSELGVRPSEVGLEYGPGLGGIAGMAIVIFVVVGFSTLCAYLWIHFLKESVAGVNELDSEHAAEREPIQTAELMAPDRFGRYRTWVISVFVAINCAVLLYIFIGLANSRADDAKHGRPVEPIEWLGVEILTLRADLTRVVPADPKAVETQAYEQLTAPNATGKRRTLLYLGRSGGTLVVYEVDRQSAWHLPASSFAVRALNCETKLPGRDPACSKSPSGD
jgi:hypothetical protein